MSVLNPSEATDKYRCHFVCLPKHYKTETRCFPTEPCIWSFRHFPSFTTLCQTDSKDDLVFQESKQVCLAGMFFIKTRWFLPIISPSAEDWVNMSFWYRYRSFFILLFLPTLLTVSWSFFCAMLVYILHNKKWKDKKNRNVMRSKAPETKYV